MNEPCNAMNRISLYLGGGQRKKSLLKGSKWMRYCVGMEMDVVRVGSDDGSDSWVGCCGACSSCRRVDRLGDNRGCEGGGCVVGIWWGGEGPPVIILGVWRRLGGGDISLIFGVCWLLLEGER